MPRKSAASLTVVSEIVDRRPSPPKKLSKSEAELWTRVVNTKPHDWWDAGTVPLLVEYCRLHTHVEVAESLFRKAEEAYELSGNMPADYEQLSRALDRLQARLAQYAMKMRLTQQARYRPYEAQTQNKKAASDSKPWQES
jgi:hypothetical protein